MQTSAIFPQSEHRFLVIEATPYMGYEKAFEGSASECLAWCKSNRRAKVTELYKLTEVEEDLMVIILSSKIIDVGYSLSRRQK